MGFQIQEKSVATDIWVIPVGSWVRGPVQSDRVSVLVQAINDTADHWPFSFAGHLRIVTDDGNPVIRYKVSAGRVKRLRRLY